MVFEKKLDYGSSSYQAPAIPHVPKSARGKRSARKKVEGNQMCAFDLLATVAGNLLEGDKSGSTDNIVGSSNLRTINDVVKLEKQDFEIKSKAEALEQHSSNVSIPDSGVVFGRQIANFPEEHTLVLGATITDSSSGSTRSKEVQHHAVKVENNEGEVRFGVATHKRQTYFNSPSNEEFHKLKGVGTKKPLQSEHTIISNVFAQNAPWTNCPDNPMDLDAKPHLLSSDSSAEVPLFNSNKPSSSLPQVEDAMGLAVDKDDENSSGCTHSSILSNKAHRPQGIGDRRIRKLLVSKYWKIPSKTSQNHEFSNYDLESKSALHSKRLCYTRQRTQRSCFKRRKFVERYSRSTAFDDLSSLYKFRSLKSEVGDSTQTLHGANGASSSSGKKSPHNSSDYLVKLGIKSFKVPELFIDIPETATVGSLKQTVMEAVTAILEGGLRIGVLFQGKKVRDENKTLRQAGISHGHQLDSLGFVLEPHSLKNSPLTCNEDASSIDIADVAKPLASLPPIAPAAVGQGDAASAPEHILTPYHDSDHDSVHLPTDSLLLDEKESNSRALVVVPPVIAGALTVVPQRKSRHPEAVQRRIRRPFTVAEVEALVQAVEKLGTGRWRDVKLCAFDNAKHRTYVDLKDKWKTLVHTAKISPQQRRGEPVPQQLLERVLSAHAYWSHQLAKLQLKPPPHAEPLSIRH